MGENFKTVVEGACYQDALGRTYGPMVDLKDGTDYPFRGKRNDDGVFYFTNTGKNISTEERNLTRVLPGADGWYPHVPGDPCPVDGDAYVQVKFRNGDDMWGHYPALGLDWGNRHHPGDLTSYRIVSEPAQDVQQEQPKPICGVDMASGPYRCDSVIFEMSGIVPAKQPSITEDAELSAIRAVLGLGPDAQKRVVGYLVGRVDL